MGKKLWFQIGPLSSFLESRSRADGVEEKGSKC